MKRNIHKIKQNIADVCAACASVKKGKRPLFAQSFKYRSSVNGILQRLSSSPSSSHSKFHTDYQSKSTLLLGDSRRLKTIL